MNAVRSGPDLERPDDSLQGEPAERAPINAAIWQTIAVAAALATALGIAVTGAIDLCRSMGPVVLALAWLIAPVVAISGIIGVAVVTESPWERVGAIVVAVAMTGVWLYALVWASVGEALQGTTC
jgi:hypothetical protein